MPEVPAVSFVQLSSLPRPSDVTMPMPVTTIMGRPAESFIPLVVIRTSRADGFDDSDTFGAPMTDGGYDDRLYPIRGRRFERHIGHGCCDFAVGDRKCCERDSEREGGLKRLADAARDSAYGKIGGFEDFGFFGSDRLDARRHRIDRAWIFCVLLCV